MKKPSIAVITAAAAIIATLLVVAFNKKPQTAPITMIREVSESDNTTFLEANYFEDEELRQIGKDAISIINGKRNCDDVSIFEWDTELEKVATIRAEEISRNFSYKRPNGSEWYTVAPDIQAGEYIVKNYYTVNELANALLESNRIMDKSFQRAAIAPYRHNSNVFWVLEYGY